jgi:hypothetical protein
LATPAFPLAVFDIYFSLRCALFLNEKAGG